MFFESAAGHERQLRIAFDKLFAVGLHQVSAKPRSTTPSLTSVWLIELYTYRLVNCRFVSCPIKTQLGLQAALCDNRSLHDCAMASPQLLNTPS